MLRTRTRARAYVGMLVLVVNYWSLECGRAVRVRACACVRAQFDFGYARATPGLDLNNNSNPFAHEFKYGWAGSMGFCL